MSLHMERQPLARWDVARAYEWEYRRQYLDLPFPESHYADRIVRTRAAMTKAGLAGILVASNRAHDGDLRWLTNFRPLIGSAIFWLPADGDPALFLHNELSTVPVWATWVRQVAPPRWGPDADEWTLQRLIEVLGPAAKHGPIGLVADRVFPVALYQGLLDQTGAKITITGDLVARVRAVKTEPELAMIRRSVAAADAAMRAAVEAVGIGVPESEVAGAASGAMMRAGAEDTAFPTIVASGPRCEWKHAPPTDRQILAGEPVYIDLGARYNGYCSDLSRTVVVGQASDAVKRGLEFSLASIEAVIAAAKTGATAAELFRINRRVAEEFGLADHTMNLGHGMGAAMAEFPVIRPDNEEPFETNMVIAIEPMIVQFGVGTLVVEDDIIVTPTGGEKLSFCPQRNWS